jgi:NADPH:quinone reductase-like Zn-dependent oxidoreductase
MIESEELMIMRAVVLAQVPGPLEVTEVDTPRPDAGELLVRVAASSVNGFDLGTAAEYPTAETLSMLAGQVASAALKVSVTSV